MSDADDRRVIEVQAPTVDEAIVRGLVRLGGLKRSEVNIEVVREGKAGLLGLGSEEAIVRLSTLQVGEGAAGSDSEVVPGAAKAQAAAEPAPKRRVSRKTAPEAEGAAPQGSPASLPVAPVATNAEGLAVLPAEEVVDAAKRIVGRILADMGCDDGLEMEAKPSLLPVPIDGEESLVLSIHGPFVDRLTARGGRGLAALQFVARLLVSRELGRWVNLLLDIDGDRARRIKEIYLMAEQSARLVEREGRPVSLPPMTPYERRVVHLALKQFEEITTQSIGLGFGRKVTVRRKDQLLPTLPQAS